MLTMNCRVLRPARSFDGVSPPPNQRGSIHASTACVP